MKKYQWLTGLLLEEDITDYGAFHLPAVLKLDSSSKINLVDQLSKELEFLMRCQTRDYTVTLNYYELT